ncbi:YlqD family protein [Candidatus Poribacteria bacterium]|nr:YlqD family protein [Candidatus Poribacteria bacterium]HDO77140.1 hypothetical protein [Candidatus Poribacteria bacterium]HEX30745.1 hypothetical protein [Candidatus Poribacteria bacterium]
MSLIVKRPVILKNIVTETFKKQLIEELSAAIKQIDMHLEQMEFQMRRTISELEKNDPRRARVAREEMMLERQRQEQIRHNLQKKLEEVSKLEIGSEFITGTYDAPVKIEVGDNIRQKLSQAEIIVKDGIVVGIRE